MIELLLQKYDKTNERKEKEHLSQQILGLLGDSKVIEFSLVEHHRIRIDLDRY